MEQNALSHLIQKIESIPLQEKPYAYFHAEGIFPENVFQELIDNIPDLSYFSSMDAYPKRRHFDLTEEQIGKLPFAQLLFWMDVYQWITGKEFARALLKKFGLKETPKLGTCAAIIRDQSEYSIGPHTDHANKVISVLFYLPTARDQKHLGTSIYTPKKKGFSCKGNGHHEFEDFDRVLTMPFLPNSAFGFARNDISFHGVEPIKKGEKERLLLNYTLWEQP